MLYLDETYPYAFRMFMIALISSVLYFVVVLYTRQLLMRILLAYKGWLCKSRYFLHCIFIILLKIIKGLKYSYNNNLMYVVTIFLSLFRV